MGSRPKMWKINNAKIAGGVPVDWTQRDYNISTPVCQASFLYTVPILWSHGGQDSLFRYHCFRGKNHLNVEWRLTEGYEARAVQTACESLLLCLRGQRVSNQWHCDLEADPVPLLTSPSPKSARLRKWLIQATWIAGWTIGDGKETGHLEKLFFAKIIVDWHLAALKVHGEETVLWE